MAASGPTARLRLVVLDLDGTLIDSLPAIAGAVDAVRRAHGAAPLARARVREAIGDGARVLAGRVFGDVAAAPPDLLLAEFLAEYRRATEADREPWLPGALALLARAPELSLELALLSNKPLDLTERILAVAGVRGAFADVRGPENSSAVKPDPRALTDIVAARGVTPAETCFVGDSVVDFATGRAARILTLGVRGGYRADGEPGPDRWFEELAEVTRWLERAVGIPPRTADAAARRRAPG